MSQREFSAEEPELLDLPQPHTPELERNLANLASLNRWFGSHGLVRGYLRRWLVDRTKTYRVLDLATGHGDVPRLIAGWAAEQGIAVEIEGVDFNEGTVEIARESSREFPGIKWITADALTFEGSGEGSYDLVCCSLALHHFSEEDAVKLLRRIGSLTRRFALVADLERGWFTTFGVWFLTTFLYHDKHTKYDGMISVRRAFTMAEVEDLARKAGWSGCGQTRHRPCRQALWWEKA